MKQTCLAQIRFLQVAESREYFYFLQRNLYMLGVLPAHGKLVLQQALNSVYGVTLVKSCRLMPRRINSKDQIFKRSLAGV